MAAPKRIFQNEEWKDDALCRAEGADPSLFFPTNELGQSLMKFRVLPVKGNPGFYCSRCPVQEECLDYAFRAKIEDGVFGNKSGDERKKLKKQRMQSRIFPNR